MSLALVVIACYMGRHILVGRLEGNSRMEIISHEYNIYAKNNDTIIFS